MIRVGCQITQNETLLDIPHYNVAGHKLTIYCRPGFSSLKGQGHFSFGRATLEGASRLLQCVWRPRLG